MTDAPNYFKDDQEQKLISLFLRERTFSSPTNELHLDEDQLNALIEKQMTQRENHIAMKHLVDCHRCRFSIVKLAELSEQFIENLSILASESKTGSSFQKIWQFLSENIFSSTDDAVFAYRSKLDENQSNEEQENFDRKPKT